MEIMPYIWFGIAVFMAIIEGATYQLVSIWFVIGAITAAVVSIFVPDNIWLQVLLFAVVSLIALLVTRPFVKKVTHTKKLPTNADRYIGMQGFVKTDIDNSEGVGQVNINGSVWSAKSENGSVIKEGTKVTVKKISGAKLIVAPVE